MKFRAEEAVFIGLFIFFSLTILFPEASIAGTGGEELQTLYEKTVAIAQGYGGKTVAVISFLLSLVGAVKGNLMACGGAFGVGVVAGIGPSMVTSGISAII
jgi:hypothetical protein